MNASDNLYKYVAGLTLMTGFILLIPLIAMHFTHEVIWRLGDFIFAGILIFGTGFTYKVVTLQAENRIYKIAVATALVSGFLLIWANLAVGIIGAESNSINLLYFGVIVVGIFGAIIARFQSMGMANTMFAAAFAQLLVTVIALFQQVPNSSVIEIIGINGFFLALWLGAAALFRFAGRKNIHH